MVLRERVEVLLWERLKLETGMRYSFDRFMQSTNDLDRKIMIMGLGLIVNYVGEFLLDQENLGN